MRQGCRSASREVLRNLVINLEGPALLERYARTGSVGFDGPGSEQKINALERNTERAAA